MVGYRPRRPFLVAFPPDRVVPPRSVDGPAWRSRQVLLGHADVARAQAKAHLLAGSVSPLAEEHLLQALSCAMQRHLILREDHQSLLLTASAHAATAMLWRGRLVDGRSVLLDPTQKLWILGGHHRREKTSPSVHFSGAAANAGCDRPNSFPAEDPELAVADPRVLINLLHRPLAPDGTGCRLQDSTRTAWKSVMHMAQPRPVGQLYDVHRR
mmetsp:Transcript_9649/g.25224  ORF Transcript_9649/g.25224 Transcript_9649/m.25224 type:complete len:212 (-) Transcript_9649:499-1134(-)